MWKLASTEKLDNDKHRTAWYKYYKYVIDDGAHTVISNKSNYNNFDEKQLMFR